MTEDNSFVKPKDEQLRGLMLEWFNNLIYSTEMFAGMQRLLIQENEDLYWETRREIIQIIDETTDEVLGMEGYAEVMKMYIFDGICDERRT